ncbi:hypothetical protein FRC11_001257, partial [Ceratobasidium sp. 423]
MTSPVGRPYPLVRIDRDGLAALCALASDAFAAAAEAMAEAARAMAEASRNTGRVKQSGTFGDKVPSALPATVVEPLAGDKHEGTVCQIKSEVIKQDSSVGCPAEPPEGDASTESGDASSTGIHAISSESSPQNDPTPGSTPTSASQENVSLHSSPEQEPELNNKLDALPPSRVTSTSNENTDAPTKLSEDSKTSGPQSDVTVLLETIKSYPTIPPGRNYVNLDHESDSLAFIAYLALQVTSVICLIPDQLMNTCSEL